MSMRGRVLFVDDEEDNHRVYGHLLKAEGFAVRHAKSGDEAFLLARKSPPDLVLSDVSMANGDGLSLVTRLRAEIKTARLPVILMSGVRFDPDDQADGLERGADDYLPRPVSPIMLRAKISAVLRRINAVGELHGELTTHGLALDVSRRTVSIGGRNVALTRKEFDLLTTFLRKPGRVLSIPFLLETVWGYDPADYSDPHTICVQISSLRRKIGAELGGKIIAEMRPAALFPLQRRPGNNFRYGQQAVQVERRVPSGIVFPVSGHADPLTGSFQLSNALERLQHLLFLTHDPHQFLHQVLQRMLDGVWIVGAVALEGLQRRFFR